jgi:protein-tyrosine phosphatase
MRSILFVCLGNICRSPLAQGIAEKIIKEEGLDIRVDSAGTGDWHIGESPCAHSIKVAALNGVDISMQKGRQIEKADLEAFDLIVALDESNYENLKKMGAENLIKLGHFGHLNADVPDPFFFEGFEGFDKVFSMIESCVTELLKEKR